MNQDEREKHVEPQLYGSSVSFKLLKPNLSHGEDPRKSSCGFGTERGRVIIVKYSQRVVHNKDICLRGKDFGKKKKSVSCSDMLDSSRPHGPQPTRLLSPWNSPGKNTGVGCHFFLHRVFLTQGSNPGLLIAGRFFSVLSEPYPRQGKGILTPASFLVSPKGKKSYTMKMLL